MERGTSALEEKDRKSIIFTSLDALHEAKGRIIWTATSEQKIADFPDSPVVSGGFTEFKKQI